MSYVQDLEECLDGLITMMQTDKIEMNQRLHNLSVTAGFKCGETAECTEDHMNIATA